MSRRLHCVEVSDLAAKTVRVLPFDVVIGEAVDTLRAFDELLGAEACRVCGCTDGFACGNGCSWTFPGLCSNCAAGGPIGLGR